MFGLPDSTINKYQAVLNSAARLIFNSRKYDHVTPLLEELHWLRARERIAFKVACLAWRCIRGEGPEYLKEGLQLASTNSGRQGLRSSTSVTLIPPRTRNVTHGDQPNKHSTMGQLAVFYRHIKRSFTGMPPADRRIFAPWFYQRSSSATATEACERSSSGMPGEDCERSTGGK